MEEQIASFFYHLNYTTSEVSSNDGALQTESGSVTFEVLVCSPPPPPRHTRLTHWRARARAKEDATAH